tara:strand:- start:51 stop:344 length:294 start_codon:yes stop_codon:yes gene_type:complete
MAIQLDLTSSQYGTAFTGAYFRIVTASISREMGNNFTVMIDCSGFATATPTDDTHPVDFRRYHTPLATIEAIAGDDFLSKCYSWVMTQDDMNGSSAV